jgi:hypothetical protein
MAHLRAREAKEAARRDRRPNGARCRRLMEAALLMAAP